MNGKKMIDKAKSIASEIASEHERKKIARAEAIAAEEERQKVEYEKQIAEYQKLIIARAKAITTENDISFMEALEVMKMADSTLDEILEKIAYEIRSLNYEISSLRSEVSNLKF